MLEVLRMILFLLKIRTVKKTMRLRDENAFGMIIS